MSRLESRTGRRRIVSLLVAGIIAPAAGVTGTVLTGSPALAVTQGGSCNAFKGAFPLGHGYSDSTLVVPACGPRPGDTGPKVFPYPGSPRYTPGYQCVEFSERFIYYRYGLGAPNVSTNGNQIVDHYKSAYPSKFTVEDASAKVPLVQGDVISFASTSSFSDGAGHTAVVQASDINASGSGNVTIVEENASSTGQRVLQVRNWAIQGTSWKFIKWLHYTATPVPPGGTGSGPGSGSGSGGGKKVDLVFAIDTTGSMTPYIDSVVKASSSIVDALDAAHADYRVGIVDYKDTDFGCVDYDAVTDLPFSTDKSAIQSALSSLEGKVSGGCDLPEDVYSGIDRALKFPWRSGVTKAVIVMGDAPGHDPEPHSGLTLAAIKAEALAVDPAQAYAILVGSDPDAHSFDQSVADATGGQTFDATSDPAAAGPAFVTAINAIVGGVQSTTTTVSLGSTQAVAGQPVTLSAKVDPVPGSGSVTFTADGVPIEECQGMPVISAGTASCTTGFTSGGTVSIGAVYSGDDSFADSTADPVSLTITGNCRTGVVTGLVTVPAGGSLCLGPGSAVRGGIVVGKGASLFLLGSTAGSVVATAPGRILMCASTIHGDVYVLRASDLVTIGDVDGTPPCAGNTITGRVSLLFSRDGVQASDNTANGGIRAVGTTGALPPPDTGAVDMQDNGTASRLTAHNH